MDLVFNSTSQKAVVLESQQNTREGYDGGKTGGNFVTSRVFMFDPRLCPAANVQHLITSKVGLQCHHCVSPCRTSGWSQARLD